MQVLAWVPLRAVHAPHILRIAIAVIFLSHGLTRAYMDRVTPFGAFLDSQGFPLGLAWAWGITLLEIIGALLLLANRFVQPLALLFTVQMCFGIWLVHWQHGWFVVGHGQYGAEYAFLIIAACLALFATAGKRRDAG